MGGKSLALRRFFFEPSSKDGSYIALSKEEGRHIKGVLRLENGTMIELLDGSGFIYEAELVYGEQGVGANIHAKRKEEENQGPAFWLGQAVLKGKKTDDVLPQITELGVDTFAPFESSRCQGRLTAARAIKKKDRWERIVDAACKQCLRPTRMTVEPVTDFKDLIQTIGMPGNNELRIFFWEEERDLLLRDVTWQKGCEVVRVLLGPEGGFTEDEAKLVQEYGWQSVSLGRRVLKADTATVAAVSLVQHLAGNFG